MTKDSDEFEAEKDAVIKELTAAAVETLKAKIRRAASERRDRVAFIATPGERIDFASLGLVAGRTVSVDGATGNRIVVDPPEKP